MRKELGLTLLELILVLVISGTLAAIAVPKTVGFFSALDEQKIADQLISDLRQARSMAQACAGVKVRVEITADSWSARTVPLASGAPDDDPECGHTITSADRDRQKRELSIDGSSTTFHFLYPKGSVEEENTIIIKISGAPRIRVTESGRIERL
ncbi:hypothetical protein CKO15_10505 [Halorhodospira abdelmalekii]|uniref:GspH/FimT family protein n=1 Tax=Halorhodospira abdelmalekii TaxID=421629 RepID=UPI00237A7BF5|nr:GspH/FimT family protein [Halorhodospira abdelmalekii]MBK1735705.1 hypothetical protein [Halorhodospira abdelmalekii]